MRRDSRTIPDLPAAGARAPRVLHIATVPISLIFFRGHRQHLRDRGFDVHVASSPGDMLDEVAAEEGLSVHPIPMSRGINPAADLASLFRLWRLMRRLRPDIVQSHSPKAGLLGTLAARWAGVPAIMLGVFGLPQMTRSGWSRSLLDATTRLSCAAADLVWSDSHSMRRHLVDQRLCRGEKLIVLGHGSVAGVDSAITFNPLLYSQDERQALRVEYGIPRDARVVGFVGRIAEDKGMHELADAWKQLRNRFENLQLLLVGPCEERNPLWPADERSLRADPRVHFAGMRRDVARHLAVCDVFVNPSYREGFGVANIEASAMELPVVSTRIPGCVDSVEDGVTGTLVPVRNVPALIAAIEAYLLDPSLRERHGRAGRERVVRDFQPQTLWSALEDEYRRLLGAPLLASSCSTAVAEKATVAT